MDILRPPKWKRVLRRTAFVFAGVLVIAVGFGFALQRWKDAQTSALRPAGSYATLDGRRIHYRVSGEGRYTFVLEAGLGDYSDSWGPLEESFAQISRTFLYDRAGLGWSDEGPAPRSAEQIVDDLHRTLEAAGIPKPYILVGHSLGGLTQTLYATRYPAEVAGLLLIDPSHKDQFKKLPSPPAIMTFLMTQLSRAAPFGLPQLLMHRSDPIANQTKHVRTSGAELRAFLSASDAWGGRAIDLGHTPIYVLTAGAGPPIPGKTEVERKAIWQAVYDLHEELVAASVSPIRRHTVIADATHYIQRTHPQVVLEAARELLTRIEAEQRPVPASAIGERRAERGI